VFFLLGILLLLLLPSPWGWLSFLACSLIFVAEISFFWRRVRGHRVQVGAETMIGKQATVVVRCRPKGQVAIGGERWEARCVSGADVDDVVTVVGRDGLALVVEPLVN
jgi:membrane protein implicated in regulation of membrane protease activity